MITRRFNRHWANCAKVLLFLSVCNIFYKFSVEICTMVISHLLGMHFKERVSPLLHLVHCIGIFLMTETVFIRPWVSKLSSSHIFVILDTVNVFNIWIPYYEQSNFQTKIYCVKFLRWNICSAGIFYKTLHFCDHITRKETWSNSLVLLIYPTVDFALVILQTDKKVRKPVINQDQVLLKIGRDFFNIGISCQSNLYQKFLFLNNYLLVCLVIAWFIWI